jgi:YidC/Oxa1 family membrane protein insertase
MQEMQPQIQKLREKYKSDRAEMQRQMMALQQEQGFNPLSGCLPMFLQIPIFISLFHVLRHLSDTTGGAAKAALFGAPLAGSLRDTAFKIEHVLGGDITSTRIVTIVLVLISAGATFMTQIMVQRAATTVPTGTAATVQRVMKVFIPISVLFSGVFFPLGVLLYWFTSNTWTFLQQMYINRYHPPKPKETVEVGTVGKTLAPKPGQRPARDARTRPAVVKEAADDSEALDATASSPRTSTPRPGQRPQRQGGNRPPGKRPSQAKKRR